MKRIILILMLFSGLIYSQSPSKSLTTNLRLKQYNQGATGIADSINWNWERIDTYWKINNDLINASWLKSGSNLYYNSGNIGIGTSTPLAKLHIYNGVSGASTIAGVHSIIENSSYTSLQFKTPNTVGGRIYWSDPENVYAGQFEFYHPSNAYLWFIQNIERMRLDSDGLGVGTGTINERLNVNGRVYLISTTAPGTTTNRLYNVAGNLYWNGNNIGVGNYWTQSGSDLYYNTGNVGIGTSTPSQKLDVVGKGKFSDEIWIADGKGIFVNGTGSGIRFYDATPDRIALTARTGINTLFPQYMLDVGGSINFTDTLFKNGSVFKEGLWSLNGSNVYYNGGNVGIGTSTPGAKLDVAGRIWQTSLGNSVFIGEGAGANDDLTGNINTAIGSNALYSNITGLSNIGVGYGALYSNIASYNVGIGSDALRVNTSGYSNVGIGANALFSNTTGNTNTAIGTEAGRYTNAGGSNQTSANSIYLGYDARSSASGNINEIVIGYEGRGNGSNTVTLGNTNITKTILRGDVGIGTATPAEKLTVQWATGVDAGFFRGTTDTDITGMFMRNPNGVLYYVWVNAGGAISTSTTKP